MKDCKHELKLLADGNSIIAPTFVCKKCTRYFSIELHKNNGRTFHEITFEGRG